MRSISVSATVLALLLAGPWAPMPASSTTQVPGRRAPTAGFGHIPREAGMTAHTVTNSRGTMTYFTYVPGRLVHAHHRVPLVVHLHGGNSDARQVSVQSRLNRLARHRGFIAVYPQESTAATGTGIWDWNDAAEHGRAARGTSLVAALTRVVMHSYPIDRTRVLIGGISAGSGMAEVMAATHPEIYRAFSAEVACMYNGLQCAGGIPRPHTTASVEDSARQAFRASGRHAARMPFLISYGTLDPLAVVADQDKAVQQWLITNDWADDGHENGSVPRTPATVTDGIARGRSFTVDSYVDARGCLLGQRYVIDGLRHAYSGGQPTSATDTDVEAMGPRMRAIAFDFATAQSKRDGHGRRICLAPPV